ncbi:MAG: galactokinase [Ruminococcus sp.]|nr:galactokinase [Ruminococcus sp.]
MTIYDFITKLNSGELDGKLAELYGAENVLRQHIRYLSAAENFSKLYPECDDIQVFSASGRTEIGGNHTDHQHGCVLAAAVSLDIVAIVAFHDEGVIRYSSAERPECTVRLDYLAVNEAEKETTEALIRGVAAGFAGLDVNVGGFNVFADSSVPVGSGLSSSAAFEILIGTIIDEHCNGGKAGAVEIARIGQYAENVYFGKASGLMDQLVSSVGGFSFIDFEDPDEPTVERVSFDFESKGYRVCITATGSSHADLSGDYSAISGEMKHVANELGCEVLREVSEEEFYEKLPELRKVCTDRELLRAAHFFAESERAALEAQALRNGDTEEFFELVNASGMSSAELLQNIYSPAAPQSQPLNLAIAISRRILGGSGAVRVHGGGFAGTIQAFVPIYTLRDYISEMERILGIGSCSPLNIRPVGGTRICR